MEQLCYPVSFGKVASGGIKLGILSEDKLLYYIDGTNENTKKESSLITHRAIKQQQSEKDEEKRKRRKKEVEARAMV
jgi:hypothetical protein